MSTTLLAALLRRLADFAVMMAVALASMLLLVYVGYGEASRTYPRFLAEKMMAQGALIQTPLETFLRAGLPLRQFPGFRQIADPIISSDQSLAQIAAWDASGAAFVVGDASVPRPPGVSDGLRDNREWLQISIPLRNRFEAVGEITISMRREAVNVELDRRLPLLVLLAVVLAIGFAIFAVKAPAQLARSRVPWIGLAYVACFAIIAAAVVATLVSLYNDGAQARVKALANSLAQRLKPVIAYGLPIEELEGVDRAFTEYLQLNPDLRAVALLRDGKIAIHSDQAETGRDWTRPSGMFEYRVAIGRNFSGGEIGITVVLPTDIVWHAVLRSVKNFAALFLASGLMAGLFLQLARSLCRDRSGAIEMDGAASLAIVKPAFFIGVFAESLAAGFLPQTLREAAIASGLGASAASTAFTLYFFSFLLALLPAQHVAERRGGRPLIVLGATLVALAWLLPALSPTYFPFLASRAIAGLGQAMLFIGVQHYILAHAPPDKPTQSAAIIVFGFNGGMIAGAALGSLLINYIAATGVFAVAATISALLALYAIAFLGTTRPAAPTTRQPFGRNVLDMGSRIPRALASFGFLRAILLIGAPAKAVLTGVIGFALPLILASLSYPDEDIGQILMLYGCGVLLASGPVSRFVDRTRATQMVLVAGGFASAVALIVMGLVGTEALPSLLRSPVASTLILAGGTFLLGLSQGCINAPIITNVTHTSAALEMGPAGASAIYRVLERIGHVLGPMIAAQLLLLAGTGPQALAWIGGGVLALSLLFAKLSRRTTIG
ncbi:MAG: MFS transporter [Alphaproteobacteria bacterium]